MVKRRKKAKKATRKMKGGRKHRKTKARKTTKRKAKRTKAKAKGGKKRHKRRRKATGLASIMAVQQ